MANISEQIKTIKNTTHDEELRDAIAEALTVLADADQSDAVESLKETLISLSEKLDSKANSSDVTRIKLTSEEINKLNELKSAINDISRQMSLKANTSDVNKLKKELDGKADSTEVSRALSLKADSTATKSMMNLYSGDGQSALKAAVEEYATETVVNLLRSYTNEQLNLKEDRSRFDAIVGNGFQGWTITDYIIRIREDYNTALAEMMTRSEFRTMKAEALEQASNVVSVNDEMDDTTRLYLDIEEELEDVELAEMSDLNALASKYDKYFTFNAPLVFELGTLDEHGWNATSTVHIRTKYYLEARDFIYTLGTVHSVQVASYDEYKMLLSKSAWLSGNVSFDIDNITGVKYIKLVVKRNDDADITSAMLNTFNTSANTNHLTMFGTDYIGDGEESVASSSLVATKADKDDLEKAANAIAPAYDSASTYAVGDYVTYGGKLYRCSTAISTAEAWTAAHWTESNVGGEISDLKEDLTKIGDAILDCLNQLLWKNGAGRESYNMLYELIHGEQPGQDVIIAQLTASDLLQGGWSRAATGYPVGAEGAVHYNNISNSKRICYTHLALQVTPGKRYKITYVPAVDGVVEVSPQLLLPAARDKVLANEDITAASDIKAFSWGSSGYEISQDYTEVTYLWLTFHRTVSGADVDITPDIISTITFYELGEG